MQCFLLCVVVIIGISGGQARPQGFFGGLLPPPAAAPAEGGSPPKGPLAIFTQGQQAAQNVVGGFISGLAETRDKIRNETKKRIQSLLGNKNKEDTEVPPQKPSEAVDPDKEVEAAPPKIEQAPDKEETSKKPHEKEETSSVFNEPLNNLEKVKQSGNIDKPMSTKGTTDNPEIDKLIEDVFADVDPTQEALGAKEKEEKKEGEEV